jgi:hypothetical protein
MPRSRLSSPPPAAAAPTPPPTNPTSRRRGTTSRSGWPPPAADEALTAIQDAVQVHRRLAAGNPAADEPDLASSRNNLPIRLAAAGRKSERANQEAVELDTHGAQ